MLFRSGNREGEGGHWGGLTGRTPRCLLPSGYLALLVLPITGCVPPAFNPIRPTPTIRPTVPLFATLPSALPWRVQGVTAAATTPSRTPGSRPATTPTSVGRAKHREQEACHRRHLGSPLSTPKITDLPQVVQLRPAAAPLRRAIHTPGTSALPQHNRVHTEPCLRRRMGSTNAHLLPAHSSLHNLLGISPPPLHHGMLGPLYPSRTCRCILLLAHTVSGHGSLPFNIVFMDGRNKLSLRKSRMSIVC